MIIGFLFVSKKWVGRAVGFFGGGGGGNWYECGSEDKDIYFRPAN